jgi:hypothetical protein
MNRADPSTLVQLAGALAQYIAADAELILQSLAPPEPERNISFRGKLTAPHVRAALITGTWPEEAWTGPDRAKWLEQWRAQHAGQGDPIDLFQKTGHFFKTMFSYLDSSLYPLFREHPFWRHFRRTSSAEQNNVLHLLVSLLEEIWWLEQVLADHGSWLREQAPQGTTPVWLGCLERKIQTQEALELIRACGILDLSVDVDRLTRECAVRGLVDCCVWAIQESGVRRVRGVEERLVRHGGLRKRRPTAYRTLPEAVAALDQVWDVAQGTELVEIWKALVDRHLFADKERNSDLLVTMESGYRQRIVQEQLWTQELDDYLISTGLIARNTAKVQLYLDAGHSLSAKAAEEVFEHFRGTRGHEAPVGSRDQLTYLFIRRMLLMEAIVPMEEPQQTSSAAVRARIL